MQRLRAESPHASIVCLGVWGAETDTNRAGLAASTYDAQDQAACQSAGGTYAPLSGLLQRASLHGASHRTNLAGPRLRFHPDDAGHEQIASAVFATLEARHLLPPSAPKNLD